MKPVLICFVLISLITSCERKTRVTEAHPVLTSPAILPLTEAIANDTTRAETWYKRGLALQKIRQDSLALQDFYRAARLDTNKAEYASAIGDLLFEHKDIAGSLQWLIRALRHNPDDARAHLKVAKLRL